MTPEQMQQKSAEKVKQVMDLMQTLNLKFEARERVGEGGFLEKVVFWIDEENYPQPEVAIPEDNTELFSPKLKRRVTSPENDY